MIHHEELDSRAWHSIEGKPDWLILMDHATKFTQPRLVGSKTDEFFLRRCVAANYPNAELRTITDGLRTYLVRRK